MKIGLFGIGLNTYWTQFEGLLARLEGYRRRIADRLAETGAEVVDAGMVDEPAKAEAAAKLLRENGAELVFLYISTYALSSTVLPVVQRLGVPVVVLNLQPEPAIDYDRLNAMGDRGRMTGRVARPLPGLLGARGGLRVQPARTALRYRHGLFGGGCGLETDRGVG